MIVNITIETTQVYKVGSRRFFTRKAAINRLAWNMINSKARLRCECEPAEYPNYPGYDCGIHEYHAKLHARLVRFITANLPKK